VRDHSHFRYEEVATFITGLVDSGTLRPGSRAPSLRDISKQQRVSLSTALQAYRLLEDRGVLEARPQSGHYITARVAIRFETPAISNPPAKASPVAISATLLRLHQHSVDPRLVPLGWAIPNGELLAAARLDRFLARAARTKGTAYNTYSAPKGELRLRQVIARRALRWGAAFSPEDIVITSGCMEAISLALSTLTQPGDTVAVESPTYFGLLRALEALGLQEQFHDFRSQVNSIHNDVGAELVAGQHFAENAGFSMIERTHGIEGMRGVAGSGFHRGPGGVDQSVRVAHAHANLAPCRFRNHLHRSGQLRRDGHHAHMPARGLPEALKNLQRRLEQIFWGMNAAALVTEKRTLQMNAEGAGLNRVTVGETEILRCFDGAGKRL